MTSAPKNQVFVALCFVCISLLCVPSSQGQANTTATIIGNVTDSSGAVVAQATIRIRNVDTATEISTRTNNDGSFVAPSLPVGTYSVNASKSGFQTYIESGIILHPATVATVNPVLRVGQVEATVEVNASAAEVQTSTSEISSAVSSEQVETLPLNGRNYQSLTALMPGTVNTSAGSALTTGGRVFRPVMTINGVVGTKTVYLLDGIPNSNFNQNTITPNPDTIEELRVLQSNYDTKYTFLGTSAVLIQTKSGTTSFHGTAFEYLRNDALNARNYFSKIVPPLKQNIFGYTLGGPVYIPNHYNSNKKKTFFFWSQQWVISHAGQVLRGATPTADMRNGIFDSSITDPQTGQPFPTNSSRQFVIPSSRINPDSTALLNALYPLPNNPAGGFRNYLNNNPRIVDQRDDEIKVDHNFTDRVRLTGEYFDERQTLVTPSLSISASPFPVNHETDYTKNKVGQIQLVTNLSNSLVNTLSLSSMAQVLYLDVKGLQFVNQVPGFQETLPFNGFLSNRIPLLEFTGGWSGQGIATGRPLPHASDLKDVFSDDISWNRGNHLIEAGGIIYKQTKRQNNNNAVDTNFGSNGSWQFTGQFTGNPIADFLLGDPSSFSQWSDVKRIYIHDTYSSAYVSDRWKAARRLTFSGGLRLSFMPLPGPQRGVASVFEPSRFNPAQAPVVNADGTITPGPSYNPLNGLVVNGVNGVPQNWFTGHQWYVAPMFGFAWDVFGNGKTSLRGGYGIVNSTRILTEDCSFMCTVNPPIIQSITLIDPSFPSPVGTGTLAPLGAPTLQNEDARLRASQIQTYSLSVQHEFPGGWLATIAGAGTVGQHLGDDITPIDLNMPRPAGGFDFNPTINSGNVFPYVYGPYQGYGGIFTNTTEEVMFWHALELGVTHPVGHNLSFSAAYTWSHDLSNWGMWMNTYKPYAYYGNVAGLNVPQVFSTSLIWDIPWNRNSTGFRRLLGGWKYSDITTIQTGRSFTPFLSVPNQGLAVVPNVVSNRIQGPKTVAEWFNASAYAAPPAGFLGNARSGSIRGPGLVNFDMAFYKDFHLTERNVFQFRAELFNIFNHSNFNNMDTTFGDGSFGQVTNAADPRIAEFALRYRF